MYDISNFWQMLQSWNRLLFAHWPVSAEQIQRRLPQGLELDHFDKEAWLGIIPFNLNDIGMKHLPFLPKLKGFPEINVRTYVKHQGRPGVYFFSLDAGASHPLLMIPKHLYHLPYLTANTSLNETACGEVVFENTRTDKTAAPAQFQMRYQPLDKDAFSPQRGTLEHWLTERYSYFSQNRTGQLIRCDVSHAPWRLQPAEGEIATNTMAEASDIYPARTKPILHYSPRMNATIGKVVTL